MGGDDEQQRAQGDLPGAYQPTQGEGAGRVGVGADDGPRPAVFGFVGLSVFGPGQRFPGVAGALEGEADLGREGVGEAEQSFQDDLPPLRVRLVPAA